MAATTTSLPPNLSSDPLAKAQSNRQLITSAAAGDQKASQNNLADQISRLNSAITDKKPSTAATADKKPSTAATTIKGARKSTTAQSNDALTAKIITEDLAWNLAEVKPLKDFCVQSIVNNFAVKPNLKKLPRKYRDFVFQSISLDLPLSLTAPLIPDDGDGTTGGSIFWRRTCQLYFPKSKCDPRQHGNSWKSNFFELYIEEILNNFTPQRSNSTALLRSLRLARPYVQRLRASQIKPEKWAGPEGAEKIVSAIQTFRDQKLFSGIRFLISDIVDIPTPTSADGPPPVLESRSSKVSPLNHFDYSMVLKELTQLKHLELFYGVQECSMGFYWNLNGISVQDAKNLANSLKLANQLESLCVRGCRMNDECCKILCAGIMNCKTLKHLNLSHNEIRDFGARAVATLIAQDDPQIRGPNITHLDLADNKITAEGVLALGKALIYNSTLKFLNLSMNQLAEDENISKMLATFVSDNYTIEELQLAGCGLGEKSVQVICDAIKHYATVNNRLLAGKDGQDKGLGGADDDAANAQLEQALAMSEGETDDDESVRSAAINKKKQAKRNNTTATGTSGAKQQATAGAKMAPAAGSKKGAAPVGKGTAATAGGKVGPAAAGKAGNKAGGAAAAKGKDGKGGQTAVGQSKSKNNSGINDPQASSDPNSEQSSVMSIAEESQRRRQTANANKKDKDGGGPGGAGSNGPQLTPPKYPCGWKRISIASNPLIHEAICGKLLFEAVRSNKWMTHVDLRATQVGEHYTKSVMAVLEENREEQRKTAAAAAEGINSAAVQIIVADAEGQLQANVNIAATAKPSTASVVSSGLNAPPSAASLKPKTPGTASS